jgi:hypothetical protein
MQSFLDIEGSGEDTTQISGSGSQTITAAADAQLRFLTVDHNGDGKGINYGGSGTFSLAHVTLTTEGGVVDVAALYIGGSGFVDASDVTVLVSGSGGNTSGHEGIACVGGNGAQPTLNLYGGTVSVLGAGDGQYVGVGGTGCNLNVDSTAIDVRSGAGNGFGVIVEDAASTNGTARISDALVQVDCGNCPGNTALEVLGTGATVQLESWSSHFRAGNGASMGVALDASGSGVVTISIADSQLAGAIDKSGAATLTCLGNYDSSYAPVTCP